MSGTVLCQMSAIKEQRVYGGRSGDERAAERRDALVAAAFALVAEHGWRALTIASTCTAAGLNKRYFYESFTGVEEVIAAVTTRLADEAIATTLAAAGPAPSPEQAVHDGITAFVTHLTDDPRRARVLFGAVPAGDAAAGHRAAAIRQLIATVAAQARSILALTGDPLVEASAAMLVGGTSQAVLDWLDGRIDTPRETLIEDLVALWQCISDGTAARLAAVDRSAGRDSARGRSGR